MTTVRKGALLFVFIALLFAGASAQAQMACQQCDPYGSCDISCWDCTELVDPQYGYCPQWAYYETTCGEFLGACNQPYCTPYWVTTDWTNVGSYGETTYGFQCNPWPYCIPTLGCDHHLVDRITQTDTNECNTNSYYWERQFCYDYVDFSLPHTTGSGPNCCAYPHYCNDWHSCF
jgi:hypothetical protein